MNKKLIVDNEIVGVTPELIAEMFCDLDSAEQARFFNEVASLSSRWSGTFPFQMLVITEEDGLNLGGRRVMQNIGEYSHFGLASKLGRKQ